MREIKFRLWCKNKNEWEKDLWWIGCEGNLYTIFHNQLRTMKKENHILMQYTGIKDKNGKEIYEGDIIKSIWNGLEQISVIDFIQAHFTAKYFSSTHPEFKHYTPGEGMHPLWWSTYSKVIGNIYENQELLKEKIK